MTQPFEQWIFEHDQFPATGPEVFRDDILSAHGAVVFRCC